MNKRIAIVLVAFFLVGICGQVDARRKKENTKNDKKTALTAYDKLFKGKKYTTSEGLMKVHQMDGKVYVEFPLEMMGKDMSLTTSIRTTSDNGEGVVGQFSGRVLRLRFTRQDSSLRARAIVFSTPLNTGKDAGINPALAESTLPGIFTSFKIEAYTPDSTAVVVDMTDLFLESSAYTNPFAGYAGNSLFGFVSRVHKFKEKRSSIVKVEANKTNVNVICNMGFNVDRYMMGAFPMAMDVPVTITINKMLYLLPEEPMRPRIADSRIGVAYMPRTAFSGGSEGPKQIYYTKRWRVEPSDVAAYKRGELVEPVKPIVFYLDTIMPENWKPYVRQGVLEWNKAFEAIGFKNVLQVKDFPKDASFDANSIDNNTIRYAPLWMYFIQNSMLTDFRTGEIMHASMYIHENVVSGLHDDRLVATMAIDPSVRGWKETPELDGEALRLKVMQIVGRCLGLTDNMAASFAYPTDSLRSASFTQKYGLSPSIMDYFMFNYIAQPEDVEKGVRLLTNGLGAYDYYAIEWLYRPILEAATPEEEVKTLDSWIRKHQNDPFYSYAPRYPTWASYDPTALYGDLGNDPLKGIEYTVKNLKESIANVFDWFEGVEDRDMVKRKNLYNTLVSTLGSRLGFAYAYIGGMYLTDKRGGDTKPSYEPVPKDVQKKVMKFVVECARDLSWLDNKKIHGEVEISDKKAEKEAEDIIFGLLNRIPFVAVSAEHGGDYTPEEYVNDLYDIIWAPTLKNKKLTRRDMILQSAFLVDIITTSTVAMSPAMFQAPRGFCLKELEGFRKHFTYRQELECPEQALPVGDVKEGLTLAGQNEGFGGTIYLEAKPYPTTHLYYTMLLKTKNMLTQAVARNTGELKNYYELLLFKVNKALSNN